MRDDNRDKDNAVRRILGIDPGMLKTGLAIFEMDENGKPVLDSLKVYQANNVKSSPFGFLAEAMGTRSTVDMEGPVRTPTWLLPSMSPPELPDGWFFWDIPTTLMVTDIKVQAKLQHLLFMQDIRKGTLHLKCDPRSYIPFQRGIDFLDDSFDEFW